MDDTLATPPAESGAAPVKTAAMAILDATDQAMARDPSVFVLGEGVADPKRIFGTTAGLLEKYGPSRVIETPISENALTGIAIGAAMRGKRPILIHQRVEFALLAMEQLVNNAAKTRYVTNGRYGMPFVMRLVIGRGWGQGPAHSQSLEPLFAHIPGLVVAMPAMPADAKSMMTAALTGSDPVVFLEHRWFHYAQGPVPDRTPGQPLTGAKVIRPGRDMTVVATSYGVYEALEAAEVLAMHDVSLEVLDLRLLRPLGLSDIVDSVTRTGRLITVDTGWTAFGAGSEIVASVAERCFGALKAPPKRLGLEDRPTASSRSLTSGYYPDAAKIISAVCDGLDLPDAVRLSSLEDAKARRAGLMPDVPNPSFKGPF